jgi:hypothetical protein
VRVLPLIFVLAGIVLAPVAVAQTTPAATILVTDENGVAVPAARVFLQAAPLPQPPLRCQTDFNGRCQFPALAPGTYQLRVEKEGFYAVTEPQVQFTPASSIDVVVSHEREVREVVDVHESPPAIDLAQVSSQDTLSGLDVINVVFPAASDYRNALKFIPGVVQDASGQPHVAGAQTYQTVTLLDGFNVTQPANGQLLLRVSTDAFRSIQVEPSREPAEEGKGSGGVLALNTGIGDDHFRFAGTDFIPSFQNKHGWRFDQFHPRFTFSGPVRKGRMWFYNALDGAYDNTVYTELPIQQDNDYTLRVGDLFKVQTNVTNRNIFTTSFLVNHLHDQYAFLSPQSPQLSDPKDAEGAYFGSARDQHYFAGGELLETGFAYDQYNLHRTPYGTLPYFVNPSTAGGSYYLEDETHARRLQALANLFFPTHEWMGRHDFKVGVDIDRISYDAQFARRPISFLSDANTVPPGSPDLCRTAVQDEDFPCTRYSTFGAGTLHEQFNVEISAYVEDRWLVTDRLLVEPGVRIDWDEVVRRPNVAPRLAGTYMLDKAGTTKISAGIGQIYDSTPIYLIARPFAGTRQDTFYRVDPSCTTGTGCVTTVGPVNTTFLADTRELQTPRSLNWSLGLEKKLPAAVYLKAEFLEKRGTRGFVYDSLNSAEGGKFILQNSRDDRYSALQITLRHNFHESYMITGSYTRSKARSNQALDFNVDNAILSAQQPGPYPWDSPNRFLSWGYFPLFRLPLLHQFEVAYSVEARNGFPFSLLSDQQELIGKANAERFPGYFSLNLQLEKRFHLFGYYWAVRGGFDNITGHGNPFFVNNVIDAAHPEPTFTAQQGRAFTSRIRLLGRK